MNDLISREALVDTLTKYKFGAIKNETEREYTKETVLNFVKEQPTVEVVPVVHGEWLKFGSWAVCNKCNHIMEYNRKSNFCPNCGADMKKKV